MKEFKEIAEKCLNRKLSGIFLTRNGLTIYSNTLWRWPCIVGKDKKHLQYNFQYGHYDDYGHHFIDSEFDIIKFISNTILDLKAFSNN